MFDHILGVLTSRAPTQTIAWLLLVFILFVTVVPVRLRPLTITQVNLDRSLAFAAMAFFFVLGYSDAPTFVAISCVAGAGLSELLQLLSPSRHYGKIDRSSGGAFAAMAALFTFALI